MTDEFSAPRVECSGDREMAGANNTIRIAKIPHHAGEKLREELIWIKDTFNLML